MIGTKAQGVSSLEEDKFSLPELSQKMALEAEQIVIYKKKGSIIEEYKDNMFSNSWERDKSKEISYKSKTEDFDEYNEGEL